LLKEAIVRCPVLTVLKLAYNELGDAGTSTIASALVQDGRHHAKLAVLDLGFNSIGDEGCESLATQCIAANYTLRELYFSGNRIGCKGMTSISGAILIGSGLSSLALSGNPITATGLKVLAGSIAKRALSAQPSLSGDPDSTFSCLESFDVGHSDLGVDGFLAIPSMLLSHKTLKALAVPGIGLTDQGIMLLSQVLSQNQGISLVDLDLSFNEISCSGVEFLMNAVWGSTSLRTLKLDNNKIGDRGAQLCAVALTSISLEQLDLSFNKDISMYGLKSLMKNVVECKSLQSLGLSGITLDQNASKALAFALAYSCSLRTVFLDSCSVGYAAQRRIVAGIVSNQDAALRLISGFEIGRKCC